jgi:ribosome-binding protein aMBF1 (putative translation factor)
MSEIMAGFLSRAELAAQLGKSERTLERWEEQKIGPPITKLGQTPYYKIDSVQEWLRTREQRNNVPQSEALTTT